jgi:hypothetical protein
VCEIPSERAKSEWRRALAEVWPAAKAEFADFQAPQK